MRIAHNMPALTAQRHITDNAKQMLQSIQKLSSGQRINQAGDDAAGLSISMKMRAQIRGMYQSKRNAQDGISLLQVAEGALSETHEMLQRMRELAVQNANGTNSASDQDYIRNEISSLLTEIDKISDSTEFNTIKLLNGEISGIPSPPTEPLYCVVDTLDFTGGLVRGGQRFIINGVTVDVADKASINDIAAALNEKTSETGAKVEVVNSSSLRFETAEVGSPLTVQHIGAAVYEITGINDGNVRMGMTVEIGSRFMIKGVKSDGSIGSSAYPQFASLTKLYDICSYINTTMNITGVRAELDRANTNNAAIRFINQGISSAGINDMQVMSSTNTPIEDIGGTSGSYSATINPLLTGTTDSIKANAPITIAAGSGAISISINDMSSRGLGLDALETNLPNDIDASIQAIDTAIQSVSSERAKLGVLSNRLQHTINNLDVSIENTVFSESRIADLDYAREMVSYIKHQFIQKVGISLASQINNQPQRAIKLLFS